MPPLPRLPGETVLWEAQPGWWPVARSIFHVRFVALYFALAFIAGAAADRAHGMSATRTIQAELPLLVFGIAVCSIVCAVAYLMARTTAYAITDRRVLLRFGVALPATLSLPLRTIGAVAVRVGAGHAGDILLTLRSGPGVGFVKLWPLVRPWRVVRPEPMLRAVPQAGMVAALLTRQLAAAEARHVTAGPATQRLMTA